MSDRSVYKKRHDDAASALALTLALQVINNYLMAHPEKTLVIRAKTAVMVDVQEVM